MRVLRGVHEKTQAMNLGVSVVGNIFIYFLTRRAQHLHDTYVQSLFFNIQKIKYYKKRIKQERRKVKLDIAKLIWGLLSMELVHPFIFTRLPAFFSTGENLGRKAGLVLY